MQIKINGESPFQILSSNFSIGPSSSGYDLMFSADGITYSKLFTVGANTNRQVTQVAAGSYYYLDGNTDEVTVNWMKDCGGGGGGGSYVLPAATQDTLGGIKVGSGLNIDSEGTLSSAEATILDLAVVSAMTDNERIALWDEVYAKVASGESVFIKGQVYGENDRTAILPVVSYRAETDAATHMGGNIYFAGKGDTDLVYFHINLYSTGYIQPFEGMAKTAIVQKASNLSLGLVKIGSGLTIDSGGTISVSGGTGGDSSVKVYDYNDFKGDTIPSNKIREMMAAASGGTKVYLYYAVTDILDNGNESVANYVFMQLKSILENNSGTYGRHHAIDFEGGGYGCKMEWDGNYFSDFQLSTPQEIPSVLGVIDNYPEEPPIGTIVNKRDVQGGRGVRFNVNGLIPEGETSANAFDLRYNVDDEDYYLVVSLEMKDWDDEEDVEIDPPMLYINFSNEETEDVHLNDLVTSGELPLFDGSDYTYKFEYHTDTGEVEIHLYDGNEDEAIFEPDAIENNECGAQFMSITDYELVGLRQYRGFNEDDEPDWAELGGGGGEGANWISIEVSSAGTISNEHWEGVLYGIVDNAWVPNLFLINHPDGDYESANDYPNGVVETKTMYIADVDGSPARYHIFSGKVPVQSSNAEAPEIYEGVWGFVNCDDIGASWPDDLNVETLSWTSLGGPYESQNYPPYSE